MVSAQAEPVAAELPSLEDLLRTERRGAAPELAVSTASRQAQSADLTPAVTHVLTRQDIDRLGLRSLADVLRHVPGLEVRQDAEFTSVAVRGVPPGDFNGRVLFLLDGLRLNENIYDAGQIDREFLVDVSLIERVEFAPGPGSALYGGNALLGVINVVTRRADSLAGPQLRLAVSPRGERQARLSFAQRLADGAEWLAAFSSESVPHVPLVSGEAPEEAVLLAPFEFDRVNRLLLGYRSGGLFLRAGRVERNRGLYSFLPVAQTPAGALDTTRIAFAQGAWDGQWQAWDVHLGLALQNSRYRSDSPNDEQPELRTDRFEAEGQWWLGELRVGRLWGGESGGAHSTSFGLDWQRDVRQRFRYQFLGSAPEDERFSATRLGVYVQDEWRLAERQRLVLGLRHDATRGGHSRWSPRAAWVWSPAPAQSIKLMWGTAFRAANRFERSLNIAYERDEPQPERLRTTELAWNGPLPELLKANWQWQASLFGSRLVQLITRNTGPFSNLAPVSTRGVELGLQGRWAGGWQAQLSFTGNRTRSASSQRPQYSPSQVAKWSVQLPVLGPQLRVSLAGWASSERVGAERLPGYAQTQAQLLWQPDPRWEAFVGVHNLGGRAYREATGSNFQSPLQLQGQRWQAGWVWRGSGP